MKTGMRPYLSRTYDCIRPSLGNLSIFRKVQANPVVPQKLSFMEQHQRSFLNQEGSINRGVVKGLTIASLSGIAGAAINHMMSHADKVTHLWFDNNLGPITGITAGVVTLGAISLASSIRQNMRLRRENATNARSFENQISDMGDQLDRLQRSEESQGGTIEDLKQKLLKQANGQRDEMREINDTVYQMFRTLDQGPENFACSILNVTHGGNPRYPSVMKMLSEYFVPRFLQGGAIARSRVPATQLHKVQSLFIDPEAEVLIFGPNIGKMDIDEIGIPEKLGETLKQVLQARTPITKEQIPANQLKKIRDLFVDADAATLEFRQDIAEEDIDEIGIPEELRQTLRQSLVDVRQKGAALNEALFVNARGTDHPLSFIEKLYSPGFYAANFGYTETNIGAWRTKRAGKIIAEAAYIVEKLDPNPVNLRRALELVKSAQTAAANVAIPSSLEGLEDRVAELSRSSGPQRSADSGSDLLETDAEVDLDDEL